MNKTENKKVKLTIFKIRRLTMIDNVFFLTGLFLILLHEMDAIRCKKWRIFPGLSMLNEKIGYTLFLFAHIPLFYWTFWQITDNSKL